MATPFTTGPFIRSSRRGPRWNPDAFELRVDYGSANRDVHIEWCSRICAVRSGLHLRAEWAAMPHAMQQLVDFIDSCVGDMLSNIAEGSSRPNQDAQAVMQMLEREVHHRMERLEREYVRGIHHDDYMDPCVIWYGADFAESPEAKKKARELLLKNLDKEQRKTFEKKNQFKVAGKDGKLYTITSARSFNVIGPDGTKYCGQTPDTPIEDQMLAQKLLLEHDPQAFFRNANKSGGAPERDTLYFSTPSNPNIWGV